MNSKYLSAPALAIYIFAIVLSSLMATNQQYGTTYDEPIYQSKAAYAQQWLEILFARPSLALAPETIEKYWNAKDQHPGFFKLFTAIADTTLGSFIPGEGMRAGTNLLVALAAAALFSLVCGVWGRLAGLYAVGSLLLMPHVLAASHFSALDAPVMAMSVLVFWALWRLRPEISPTPQKFWSWTVFTAILWGLSLGTKLNAFFLPFIIVPWLLLFGGWKRAGWLTLALMVIGPLVFWLTWPWLWYETGPRFAEYFKFHLKHWEIGVTYFGHVYTLAPWHYPLVMTAITMPPVTLFLALIGFGKSLAGLRRCKLTAPVCALIVLALWGLLVNYLPSCLPSTPKYNGVRLFLPVFPLWSILATATVYAGYQWFIGRYKISDLETRAKLAVVLLFILLLGPISAVAKFSPFHLSYYNMLVGGLPGATKAGFEPTYWGDAYRSAAIWLVQKAQPGDIIWVEPPGVESVFRLFELMPYRQDVSFSAGPEGFKTANWAVTQNKSTEFTDITRRLVAQQTPAFTDGVDGVPLIYVFKLK